MVGDGGVEELQNTASNIGLKARMPEWSAFVLVCVSSSGFVSYASQTSTGTKMPRTSWRTMSRYEICQRADAVAAAFQHVVSPMFERIVANVHESRTLVRCCMDHPEGCLIIVFFNTGDNLDAT